MSSSYKIPAPNANAPAPRAENEYPERPPITHVALRFRGEIYSLPKPNRHHDVIRHIAETTGVQYVDCHGEDQGFLDANGRYLNRRQALANAQLNNQLLPDRPVIGGELYSENLWKGQA